MAIANLAVTSTFRTWYNTTNEIIDFVNNKVIGDNNSVFGVYTVNKAANTSVNLCNGFFINNASIVVNTAMSIGANVSVSALANVVTITANNLIVQPIQGTVIQTPVTINAAAAFLKNITVTGNLSMTGDFSVVGNSAFTGPTIVRSGGLHVRQILYSQTGATAANTVSTTINDNFSPAGLADAEILNLTPNVNTAITGIAAPSVGARLLHIQNLSDTYYISLYSANTGSQAENRITTPANAVIQIAPGGATTLIYTKTNNNWRVLAPTLVTPSPFAGNVYIYGTLTVAGNSTFISPISVTSASQSYIPYLRTGTFLNDTLATFSASAIFNGTTKMMGRFVLPVGTNLWATA